MLLSTVSHSGKILFGQCSQYVYILAHNIHFWIAIVYRKPCN